MVAELKENNAETFLAGAKSAEIIDLPNSAEPPPYIEAPLVIAEPPPHARSHSRPVMESDFANIMMPPPFAKAATPHRVQSDIGDNFMKMTQRVTSRRANLETSSTIASGIQNTDVRDRADHLRQMYDDLRVMKNKRAAHKGHLTRLTRGGSFNLENRIEHAKKQIMSEFGDAVQGLEHAHDVANHNAAEMRKGKFKLSFESLKAAARNVVERFSETAQDQIKGFDSPVSRLKEHFTKNSVIRDRYETEVLRYEALINNQAKNIAGREESDRLAAIGLSKRSIEFYQGHIDVLEHNIKVAETNELNLMRTGKVTRQELLEHGDAWNEAARAKYLAEEAGEVLREIADIEADNIERVPVGQRLRGLTREAA